VLRSLSGDEALGAGGLGVTPISELLGREGSQVSRAPKALADYGLVERNTDSAYRLGWKLYAIAKLAGDRRLLEAAAPRLHDLALALGERAHLSVLQGNEVSRCSPSRQRESCKRWGGRGG
jgi:IclR family transcriptional regulator, KDG regulon repressor